MTDYDKAEQVKNLIQELLDSTGFSSRVEYEDSLLNGLIFNISSRESRSLIGRQGTNLHALEILIHAIAAKKFQGQIFLFSIDVDDYKRKREWLLKETAKQAVEKLKSTGRQVSLEPMPNYERRIIHLYIQDNHSDVTSASIGNDTNRKIVLNLK